MPTPFADLVTSPMWRSEAEAWIATSLAAHGRAITGAIEQPRVRPWSTQLVVPTDDGKAWFKANCPGLAHEAAVHAALAALVPDIVDEPLAVDTERGWLLTRDRGPTLADGGEPDEATWCAIARETARLQRRLTGEATTMLATGVPDCSPDTVGARFDELLDRLAGLPDGHPSHLDEDGRSALVAVRPQIAAAVDALLAGPVPPSLNHGDVHPNNVLLVDGSPRLFDFGDAQWTHPFEVLGPTWAWLTRVSKLPYQPVFDAYADEWADLVTADEFDDVVAAAMITLPVNRSLTWWHSVELATEAELADWGNAPLSQLRHVLEPWPPTD